MSLRLTSFLLPIVALTLTGCFQQALLIELNADGSGRLIVRRLLNKDFSSSETDVQTEETRQRLSELAAQLGEGVEFVEIRKADDKTGWTGHEAVYSFTDISKVTIPIDFGRLCARKKGDDEDADKPLNFEGGVFRFGFAAGETATLTVLPNLLPASSESEADDPFAQAGLKTPAAKSANFSIFGAEMARQILQDARLSILVDVQKPITATNAPKRATDHSVFLIDADLETFANSSQFNDAIKQEKKFGEWVQAEAPGLIGPRDDKPVTITFPGSSID